MTWSNGTFPSSPLSRSALRGDSAALSDEGPIDEVPDSHLTSRSMLGLANSPNITTTKLAQRRIASQPQARSHWTAALSSSTTSNNAATAPTSPPPPMQQQPYRRSSGPTHHAHSPYATSPLSSARDGSRSPPRWSQASPSPSPLQLFASPASPSSPLSPRSNHAHYSPSSFTSRRRTSAPVGSGGGAASWGAGSSLVGSYEESLLSGRMSSTPSRALSFDAELGVLGLGKCKPSLKCPPHLNLSFGACFYSLEQRAGEAAGLGSPYVGTIDIEGHFLDVLAERTAGALADERRRRDTSLGAVQEEERGIEHHSSSSSPSAPASPEAWHSRRAAAGAVPLSPSPRMRNGEVPRPLRSPSTATATAAASEALPLFPGYRVPAKGQIQVVIKNPNYTAVKLFLVPYDLSDMQPGTKTFIRQKCHVVPAPQAANVAPPSPPRSGNASPQTRPMKETLRYAIHLQFCAPPLPVQTKRAARQRAGAEPGFGGRDRLPPQREMEQLCLEVDEEDSALRTSVTRTSDGAAKAAQSTAPRIYLHKTIRVVFAARVPDKSERLSTVTEMPGLAAAPGAAAGLAAAAKAATTKREGVYTAYAGPGDEWRESRAAAKEAVAAAATAASRQSAEADLAGRMSAADESGARDIPPASQMRPMDGVIVASDAPSSALTHTSAGSTRSTSTTLSSPQGAVSFPAANLDNGEQHKPRERRLRQGSVASSGASSSAASRASSRRTSSAAAEAAVGGAAGLVGAQTAAERLAAARATSPTPSNVGVERSLSPTASEAGSVVSVGAHENRALLEAWHQTLRRAPSYSHARPVSPASGVALPLSFAANGNGTGTSTARPASPAPGGLAARPLSPPNVRRIQAAPLSPTKLRSLSELDQGLVSARAASPVPSKGNTAALALQPTSASMPAPARQTRPASPSSHTAELSSASSSGGGEAVRGLMTSLEELRLARPALGGRRKSSQSSSVANGGGGSNSNGSSPSNSGFLPPRMERVISGGSATSAVSSTSVVSGETTDEASSQSSSLLSTSTSASAAAAAAAMRRSRAASLLEMASSRPVTPR